LSNNNNLSGLNITIVGLGLMGGSLAKVLHPQVNAIVAVDPDRHSLETALAQGVISRGTNDLKSGVTEADVIILATPVKLIVETLRNLPLLQRGGTFVMDLGSTKAKINDTMSALPDNFEAIGEELPIGQKS